MEEKNKRKKKTVKIDGLKNWKQKLVDLTIIDFSYKIMKKALKEYGAEITNYVYVPFKI